MMKQRANYGIDGPGVVRANIVSGSLLALIAAIGLAWPRPSPVPASASIGAAIVALVPLFFAAAMFTQTFDQVMMPPKTHVLGTPNRNGQMAH